MLLKCPLPQFGVIVALIQSQTSQSEWRHSLLRWSSWIKHSGLLFDQVLDYTTQIPLDQIYAALGLLFVATILLLFFGFFKQAKSNTILLTGLSGSGKTLLFHQLRDGYSPQRTVTSMEPNEGSFVLHSETTEKRKIKPIHLVDVPCQSHLQSKLHDLLPYAAGIVFVVDALDFFPKRNAASEYLYNILTDASVIRKKVPVLILCNKTDRVTAHSKDFIWKQMEKEIGNLRASRVAESAADAAVCSTLGITGEAFTFSQCHNKVMVAEASALNGEVYELEQFIREHVRP